MPPVTIPTGSDLATYMARSDPGDFDGQVQAAFDYIAAQASMDPFTDLHREAVLAQAALQVESRGYRGGVQMTDYGPVYARRRTTALDRLLALEGLGGFA